MLLHYTLQPHSFAVRWNYSLVMHFGGNLKANAKVLSFAGHNASV